MSVLRINFTGVFLSTEITFKALRKALHWYCHKTSPASSYLGHHPSQEIYVSVEIFWLFYGVFFNIYQCSTECQN